MCGNLFPMSNKYEKKTNNQTKKPLGTEMISTILNEHTSSMFNHPLNTIHFLGKHNFFK